MAQSTNQTGDKVSRYNAEYYRKNKDKILERNHSEEGKKRIKAYNATYYRQHKDEIMAKRRLAKWAERDRLNEEKAGELE